MEGNNMVEIAEDQITELYEVISEQLGIGVEKIHPKAKFIDDLGADSLDTVELMMAIEELIGREIDDSVAESFITVGDVINFMPKN